MASHRIHRAAGAAALLLASGCGAGVIGGILASDRGRGSGTPAPTLFMDPQSSSAGLLGLDGEERTVAVQAYTARDGQRPSVELRFPGIRDEATGSDLVVPQNDAKLVQILNNSTSVSFELVLLPLSGLLGERGLLPLTATLPAELSVFFDGVRVAPPLPFFILPTPQVTLVPQDPTSPFEFLSAAGGSQLTFRVRNSRSTAMRMPILWTDQITGNLIGRELQEVQVMPIAGSSDVLVTGTAPSTTYPVSILAGVFDPVSGFSPLQGNIVYRPEVRFASPAQQRTFGGSELSVSGQALLPLKSPAAHGEDFDFDRVRLFIERGGRRVQVPPGQIRRLGATTNRLAFELPPSPDGRPGPAQLTMEVEIGAATVTLRQPNLFTFGDAEPVFGPRGTVLTTPPNQVAFGAIEDNDDSSDAVVASAAGGVPRVELFGSLDNGILRRAGLGIAAGTTGDPFQRRPRQLLVSDVDRDGLQDVLVMNRGTSGMATHTALRGRPRPEPPLAAIGGVIVNANEIDQSTTGDFNGDGRPDVVLLPPPALALPVEIALAVPDSGGTPRFVRSPLPVPATAGFQAVSAADLDGDGSLDLALARGEDRPRVVTLYGRGDGTFDLGQDIDLSGAIPGYSATADAAAVGIHAVGPAAPRALVLVLAGAQASMSTTPPAVVVLAAAGSRSHALPGPETILLYPGLNQPFGTSAVGDLDGDGSPELVVANVSISFDPPLRLYRWSEAAPTPTLVELTSGIDPGTEPISTPTALWIGTVVPGRSGRPPQQGLFVAHRNIIGLDEHRVSILIAQGAGTTLRLQAQDAAQRLPFPIEGIAMGHFADPAERFGPMDVALASSNLTGMSGIRILVNDGIGTLSPGPTTLTTLIPSSLTTMRVTIGGQEGDALVFLDSDAGNRWLGLVPPGWTAPPMRLELTPLLKGPARQATLLPGSRIAVGDVDGDGTDDLVLLLVVRTATGPVEDEGQVLLLLGRRDALANEMPLLMPDPQKVAAVSAHGDARSVCLGDFASEVVGARIMEVAVAVAGAGNHVRFFRLDRSDPDRNGYRLVRSFTDPRVPALIAGEAPEAVAAADFDGDGSIDLAVTSTIDHKLNLFLNSGTPDRNGEIDIAGFRPVLLTSPTLPDGLPRDLLLRDLNGDGRLDVLVSVANSFPSLTSLHYFLTDSTGSLSPLFTIPDVRLGARVWDRSRFPPQYLLREGSMVMAVGDLNGDMHLDLVAGWNTSGGEDRNLRLLFGSTR